MYSSWCITVPANTAKSAPHRQTLYLSWGFIDYFAFWMYPESVGLTHFTIEYQARQLYPWDLDEDFSIPGTLMEYHPATELKKLPYDLEVVAWNLDDTFSHDIHIFVGCQRRQLLETLEEFMERA